MNSKLRKIMNCVLDENKEDFSSLLHEEINSRIEYYKKVKSADVVENIIFPSDCQQTLNINEENYENSMKFIPVLTELSNKKGNISVTFNDNSSSTVTSDDAENIIKLHDSLNEENQIKLRVSLVTSKESYQSSANFAKKYTTNRKVI
tara:strand:- start:10839 stop:11282 length:444 start_codon:yes stop_codon:yes gene_type:complete